MSETKPKTITYPVVNQEGDKVSTIRLNSEVFGVEVHEDAMHRAVNVYLANRRQATAKTKHEAKSVAVVKNHGVKKEQAVQEQVVEEAQSGSAVELSLVRPATKTTVLI